jgi:hypothetical protein
MGLCVLLSAVLAGGCGQATARVKGQVRFAGQPVETGTISFEPADRQGPTAGGTIRNGTYELTEPIFPGSKIVRIRAMRKTGRKVEAGPPLPKGHLVDVEEQYLPALYNDKTTLTADITPGKINEVDFDLKASK